MDKLSERVKELMFAHPTLYPTRFAALLALFSGNGGYCWAEDGTIVPDYRDGKDTSQMDYSDLDERAARLVQDSKQFKLDVLSDVGTRFAREIRLERLQRQFIETNIELVATTTMSDYSIVDWERVIGLLAVEYSWQRQPIYCIPENAEKSFVEGALELISVICPALYRRSETGTDQGVRNALIELSKKIKGITPEMEAAQLEIASKIIAEIVAEEN